MYRFAGIGPVAGLSLTKRQEVVVTIALHGLPSRRTKPSPTFRIHLTTICHWLANKSPRRVSACEIDRTSDHYLRDMGIESREMYDVSDLSLKCLRVGPRGP
jgi:hypothetical protein